MMHRNYLHIAKDAVRAQVCTHCTCRPWGEQAFSPGLPHFCEFQCPIFVNLPVLWSLVQHGHEVPLPMYERAIRRRVCEHCTLSDTAGDYCSERSTANCALTRYQRDVIEVLEKLAATRQTVLTRRSA